MDVGLPLPTGLRRTKVYWVVTAVQDAFPANFIKHTIAIATNVAVEALDFALLVTHAFMSYFHFFRYRLTEITSFVLRPKRAHTINEDVRLRCLIQGRSESVYCASTRGYEASTPSYGSNAAHCLIHRTKTAPRPTTAPYTYRAGSPGAGSYGISGTRGEN